MTMTVETLENITRITTALDDVELITYELTTDLRPVANATFTDTSKNDVTFEKVVLINGTELELPTRNTTITPTSSLPIELPYPPQNTRGDDDDDDYIWDGVTFVQKSLSIKYTHPNRTFYNFSPWNNWHHEGNQLVHYHFSDAMSSGLFLSGLGEVAGAVGGALEVGITALGFAITPEIAIAIAGAVIVIAGVMVIFGFTLLDEAGCIWFWYNSGFHSWLADNAFWLAFLTLGYTEIFIANYLNNDGYFRIGDLTCFNGLNLNEPAPPAPPPTPTLTGYASTVVTDSSSIYGGSYVNYPYNMQGEKGDDQFGYMYSGSGQGGKATVIATMYNKATGNFNAQTGHLYLNATGMSYGSRLLVFGSMSSSGGWFSITNQLVSNTSPNYVFCGYVNGSFKYLSIVAYNSDGTASYLNIDSIEVWNWL
jgi:hypothetical protein